VSTFYKPTVPQCLNVGTHAWNLLKKVAQHPTAHVQCFAAPDAIPIRAKFQLATTIWIMGHRKTDVFKQKFCLVPVVGTESHVNLSIQLMDEEKGV